MLFLGFVTEVKNTLYIYTYIYMYIYIYINTYAIVPHVVFGYSLLFTLICTSISCVLVKCYTSIIAIIAIIINHQSSYHCIYILYIYIHYTILYYTSIIINNMVILSQMLHGAGIFTYIEPKNDPFM